MQLKKGALLQGGRYRIERVLGKGGFGITYLAVQTDLDCKVAIKEFFMSDFCNRDAKTSSVSVPSVGSKDLVEKFKQKFIREAKSIASFHHPGIVRVSAVFEENGTAYYVMDYIDGGSLADLVKVGGRLPERQALFYIRQVADALGCVHSRNMLHLDLKPENIMLDGNERAVLIDFGVSKQYDEVSGNNTSTLLGYSLHYAPPEQMRKSVQSFFPATDIYSLGATLYNLLSGITPVESYLRASGDEMPPLPSSVSMQVRHAIEEAMQLNKLNRPQSVEEFLALLDATSVTPPPPPVKSGGGESTEFPDETPKKDETTSRMRDNSRPVEAVAHSPKKVSHKKWLLSFVFSVLGILALVLPMHYCSEASDKAAMEQLRLDSIAKAVVTYKVGDVEFKMIEVKGGTFRMGATKDMDSDAESDESPVHDVTLSDYYIGETEVTQELWQAVMGSNPSYFTGNLQRPVEEVSWNDCQTFIGKLNELTGGNFRLPTEAEWEYAARGGNKSRGYKYSGSDNIDEVAWYTGNSGVTTHAIKSKSPNELGIYDMTGNVFEWCEDRYGSYSSASQTNPKGPSSDSNRVNRGGSWLSNATYCRCANRGNSTPSGAGYGLGLRLVSQ